MTFKPQRWAYEPIAMKRQRDLAKFDTLRDQISPLVANGDGLSLLKAQQTVQAARVPAEKKQAQTRSWMQKIGDQVRQHLNEASNQPDSAMALPDFGPGFYDRPGSKAKKPAAQKDVLAEAAPGPLEALNAPGAVVRGVIAGAKNPKDILGNVRKAVEQPGSFSGVGTGPIRNLPDQGPSIGPIHLTPKTLTGFGYEAATDPLSYLGGSPTEGVSSLAERVGQRFGRKGATEVAEEAAYTRLYRSIHSGSFAKTGTEAVQGAKEGVDRWWTANRHTAEEYARLSGDPNATVVAIDVPTSELHRFSAANLPDVRPFSGEPHTEFFLPAEAITKSRPIQEAESTINSAIRQAVQNKYKPSPIGGGASRTGNRLLQLPDTQQLTAELGREPTTKDIFKIDRMGRRQVTAQANKLHAQAQVDFKALGPVTKDAKGNYLVKGIAPDARDIARGQKFAPLNKVIEKPMNYALTPEQMQAAQRLASIPELIKNERNAFGVGPRVMEVNPDEQFVWRKAKTNAKGVETNKPRPSAGGRRLGGGGDKTRVFENIDDALDAGVVYAHPMEAFDQNVMGGLKKSVDEHVKNMLIPFSDSAAERVSPALRAQNDYLHQRLTSLKGTLGRLDVRTRGVVDSYINSANPDLDALYHELGQIASRKGRLPQDVATDLKQTMSDIRKLQPRWRREIRQARAIPAGRSTVPMDVAPALAGRDFEPQVAQRIEDYYRRTARIGVGDKKVSLRADVPAARAMSSVLTPIRATGDFSALLMNQVSNIARHPLTFAKNVAVGFRDMVDDAHYNEWLSSGAATDAARHGVAIAGPAGEPLELQFSNWFDRIPGIKQVNNHYIRFNNRMRVDMYNMAVQSRGGAGAVDDAAKEAIARSINRFTGVSTSQATDLETITSFAPEFTRAHLENLAAAVAKGGVEGSLARQHIISMLGGGAALVTGIALAQGRDPREVLQPVDMDALKSGRIRMNPNFMTVRAFGQDVKIFGKYDSLMRLAAVTESGLADAIGQREAMRLFDPVGYFAGGSGSPAASFLASLIKGQTFEGNAPLSPQGLARNVVPFTGPEVAGGLKSAAQNALQGDFSGAGNDLGAVTLNLAGGKVTPVTPKEQIDIESQRRFGVDYKDTDKYQRRALASEQPQLVQNYERSARGKSLEEQKVKDEYGTLQENRDAALLSGTMNREDWVNKYYDDLTAKRAKLEQIYGDKPIAKPKNPLERYIQILQQATDPQTGVLDHDKVDAGMATLSQEDHNYIDARVGMDDTPLASVFRDVKKQRRERNDLPKYRGFTAKQADDIDALWQEVRNNARSADRLDMLKAFRIYLAQNPVDDSAVVAGVRRRINGSLRTLSARQNYDKAHPGQKIFYGSGKLTQAEIAYLNGELAKAAWHR